MRNSLRTAAAASLFVGAMLAVSVPVVAQVPNLPPPPEQAVPLVNALSPAVFQACLGESVVAGLVQTGAAVAPVPIQVNDVLSPVRNALLLDAVCAYFSPKIVPASCDADETIYGSLPDATAVTVPQPASLVATEVYAAEAALNAYGAPVGNQLSSPLWGQLGCTN